MLKRSDIAILENFKMNHLEIISFVLKVLDDVEGSNLLEIFEYVYIDEEKLILEDICEYVNTTLSTLKRKIQKLNQVISSIEKSLKNKKSTLI